MLNYHHLRNFWMVAHEGGITRAAEKYTIAQSALSTQISALEASLGQALFERVGRRLELTEAGTLALAFADTIFAQGDELLATFGRLTQPQRQVLRVGALATLSRNFQLEFLRAPLADPEIEVVVRSGSLDELLHRLETFALDIVLANTAPTPDRSGRWVVHMISEQPVSLVGRPRQTRSADLEQLLRDEPLVLPSAQSSIRTGFDALLHRLGIQARIAVEVDDMAMLRLVAREHRGLAVVPSIVVRDELDSGLLVEVAQLPGLAETFFAITHARSFPNPLLRLVLPRDDRQAV
jgi:LysR family transcriptional activator of nhaA